MFPLLCVSTYQQTRQIHHLDRQPRQDVNLNILTRLSAWENFVEFCCHKSFKTYISARHILDYTQHNGLIFTIPRLPFLTPTQHRFSLTYLLLASAWGFCPPQPVSLLEHVPPSDWLRLLSSQTFSHINTPPISSQLFFLLTPPM